MGKRLVELLLVRSLSTLAIAVADQPEPLIPRLSRHIHSFLRFVIVKRVAIGVSANTW